MNHLAQSDELINLMCYVVNTIYKTGSYPNELKKTRVCPLFKGKGDKGLITNYRPITIVPTMSKVVESLVSSAIMNHMETNNLLTDVQYAYRKGRSTTSAALQLINEIIQTLDSKLKVAAIFLDLSKAFDSIDHQLLIHKVKMYGIKGVELQLLESFLKNREQIVEVSIDDKKLRSKPKIVPDVGVPQGSALGNTLFLLFMNDLAQLDIDGKFIIYADDTTIVIKGETIHIVIEKIQKIMATVKSWFNNNGLTLNSNKTNVVFFSGKTNIKDVIKIDLSDHGCLYSSNAAKMLGFNIDSAMTWKTHIDYVCEKMASGVYALKQLRPLISQECLIKSYYAYVHSIMSYGIILWGNSSDHERVLKMQKRAIRVIMKAGYKDTCREFFKSLKIMTSVALYIFETILFVRQNIHGFRKKGTLEHPSRCPNDLCLSPHKLAMSKKRPGVIGRKLYNHLPNCIKIEQRLTVFSARVKDLLINKTLYSLNEFLDMKL